MNNVQFVVAKPHPPLLAPLFDRGERSPSVVGCDRLRVIKPLTHCCSCSRTNPRRTHCSLTSERCNLLSRRHEVLLTNAHCQRRSQCEAVAQIKTLRPRKLLNICPKPVFFKLNFKLFATSFSFCRKGLCNWNVWTKDKAFSSPDTPTLIHCPSVKAKTMVMMFRGV